MAWRNLARQPCPNTVGNRSKPVPRPTATEYSRVQCQYRGDGIDTGPDNVNGERLNNVEVFTIPARCARNGGSLCCPNRAELLGSTVQTTGFLLTSLLPTRTWNTEGFANNIPKRHADSCEVRACNSCKCLQTEAPRPLGRCVVALPANDARQAPVRWPEAPPGVWLPRRICAERTQGGR